MSDDERVLRSFVAEDEALLGLWNVTQIKRSKGHVPPSPVGEETVAVTAERVLWFQNELEEVRIGDLEDAEAEYVEQQAAPPMVMGGGLLFVLGIFVSIGGLIAGVGDTLLLAMPALTGLAVFLGTRVLANVTDSEGETRNGHRLRLWTDDGPVSIWGHDQATMDAVKDAIGDQVATLGDSDDDGEVESPEEASGETSTDAGETVDDEVDGADGTDGENVDVDDSTGDENADADDESPPADPQ